jgi:hypothetical protein
MFDTNKFKRSVKDWVRDNPNGSMEDFVDFCEELIPPAQFNAYGWLVEQTLGWYDHVLSTRRSSRLLGQFESEDVA